MVSIQKGCIVRALAGKEKGSFYVALGADEKCRILIADGDRRRLENPKPKNIKHLSATAMTLDMTDITNKKLRQQLRKASTQGFAEDRNSNNGEGF